MNELKRSQKENIIIDSAIEVFQEVGFKNAKMEDIASKAGITKVTLYSYFKSKENLYLAVTYKAMYELNTIYTKTIKSNASKNGLESTLQLLETFMNFCEQNYFYSEVLLEYFAMIRSTSVGKDETKLTDAVKESIYYQKLQELQNVPYKLTVKEIDRGKKDGSIQTNLDSMLLTLHGWTSVIGFIKVLSASGDSTTPLFKVDIKELKNLLLRVGREIFSVDAKS